MLVTLAGILMVDLMYVTMNQTFFSYIEDITRWCEHMKFIFEWKKYFISKRIEREDKLHMFNQRVNFFLLH